MRTTFALLFLLSPAAAFAQDRPPQGIGFAQAEEGTWLCRHEQPEEALSCARELCIEQASGQECWPTAWCFPANWSGLMVVWLGDFHATQVLCGAPSEAALTEAMRALCSGDVGATHCDLYRVIDPEGNERDVEGISFAGPAAPASPMAPEAGTMTPDSEAAPPEPVDGGTGVPQAPPPPEESGG